MPEIKTITSKVIEYKGLLSIQGVYKVIRDWLKENGYNPFEAENREEYIDDEKQIIVWLKGNKEISDYANIEWEFLIEFLHCKEVVVEKEDQQARMHKAELKISTKGYLITDYEKNYEQTAFLHFIRVLVDKFIYKGYLSRAVGQVKQEYNSAEDAIKSFLNMEQFK